jgi:RNA polymerase sigma-70 factor (family 1)
MSFGNNHPNKFLLAELQKSNSEAFRKLFELYWESMFANAKTIVGRESVAKDIVQDIWVKLWDKRETAEIINFEAYIFKAVRNSCYKYFRDKKFNTVQLDAILALHPVSESEIKKQHDLEEIQNRIRQSLNKLPHRCKQIFELSRLEQYTNQEIALKLGISKRSVENQISLAIKSIRHSLSAVLLFLIS